MKTMAYYVALVLVVFNLKLIQCQVWLFDYMSNSNYTKYSFDFLHSNKIEFDRNMLKYDQAQWLK